MFVPIGFWYLEGGIENFLMNEQLALSFESEHDKQSWLLLSGIDKSVIERGRVLCEPKSVCSYIKFSDRSLCFKEREGR